MYHNVVLALLIQLFVAPCIQALGILLPLYIYPGPNCSAWLPVFDAISAESNTKWYIIVNPDSGPGSTDQLYQTCVSQIPSSNNQVIMGYVDTQGGNVEANIDTYAGWDSSARPVGIFFNNINPTANQLSTYQNYTLYAHSKGFSFIGLDPGETTDASYFSMADLVNTYEDSYSSFNASSLDLSGTISKQSVILVNAPPTGSYSTVISQLEAVGAAAVYITNVADTDQDVPAQLSEFASEVGSAGRGATTASHRRPPIAAIVGGVLGAFVILLVFLVLFLCMRRRRRGSSASPETVAPFPIGTLPSTTAVTSKSSQYWPQDINAQLSDTDPEVSTLDPLGASTSYDPTSAVRLSAVPTYGPTTARRVSGSALASLAGAPPSYHN